MAGKKTVQSINLNLDSDPVTRKGVMASIVLASTDGGVTRLDFVNPDIPEDEGSMRAVLSSRVYMSNENLLALRDMLNTHTATWKVEAHDAQGE